MVADTPGHSALFTRCRGLVCLAFDAEVHDVVSADSAIIYDNVPCPQCDGIPLLDFEALLCVYSLALAVGGFLGDGSAGRIRHIDIGHCGIWNRATVPAFKDDSKGLLKFVGEEKGPLAGYYGLCRVSFARPDFVVW